MFSTRVHKAISQGNTDGLYLAEGRTEAIKLIFVNYNITKISMIYVRNNIVHYAVTGCHAAQPKYVKLAALLA